MLWQNLLVKHLCPTSAFSYTFTILWHGDLEIWNQTSKHALLLKLHYVEMFTVTLTYVHCDLDLWPPIYQTHIFLVNWSTFIQEMFIFVTIQSVCETCVHYIIQDSFSYAFPICDSVTLTFELWLPNADYSWNFLCIEPGLVYGV